MGLAKEDVVAMMGQEKVTWRERRVETNSR